ncbi:MAG: 4-(cytidine 5'-diphospho)-2-C-methyl-D-erythritol kinase [Actinomycetota bacterium]
MTPIAAQSVLVRVPAKINLQLSVGPKEADGFHGLVTVFQSISLYDDVTVSLGEEGSGIEVEVIGDQTHGVPLDSTNLSCKAAALMCEKFDLPTDLKIEIKKSIPVAGGLAGGSADAAGTIVAIDALFSLGLSREEMHAIAATLGSDVPFMLSGGTAVGRGRGDQVTAALSRGTYHWVLALSTVGLSTPAVYGECDRLRAGMQVTAPKVNDQLLQSLLAADAAQLGKTLVNDLQPAACSLRPALRLILDVGEEYGALGSIVSGSGPTVAFLVTDEDHALDLAVALTSSGVVGSVTRVSGPVPGAKVIEIH